MQKSRWVLEFLFILGLAACAGGPQTPPPSGGPAGSQQGGTGYGQGPSGGIKEENMQPGSEQGRQGGSANAFQNSNSQLNKKRIYFNFDSSNIEQKYRSILKAHAKYLTSHPQARVRLEGNTDERGTREYNIGLGQRRAKSVAQFLELQGVSSDRITTISYGEERPIATGHNKQAWAKNRRVRIVYTNRGSSH